MSIDVLPRQAEQEARATLLAQHHASPASVVVCSTPGFSLGWSFFLNHLAGLGEFTFVAPASGRVLVRATGYAPANVTTNNWIQWGVLTTDPSGVLADPRAYCITSHSHVDARREGYVSVSFEIGSLVPGRSYTWRIGCRAAVSADVAAALYVGGNYGPFTVEVSDAAVTTMGYMTGGVWHGPQAVLAGSPSNVGLVVAGASGQVQSLQEWKDSAGAVKAKVDKDGRLSAANLTDGWLAYPTAPTLRSFNNNASIGSGSISGTYAIVGKTCFWRVVIHAESNTTFGTGGGGIQNIYPSNYLPANEWMAGRGLYLVGNSGGTQPWRADLWPNGGNRADLYVGESGLQGNPFQWGQDYYVQGFYPLG